MKNISTTCSIALFPRLLGIKLWGKAWWMWRCGGGSVWWSEALMLLLPCSIPLGFFSYSLSRFLLLLKESWASSSLKQNLKTEEEYQGIQRPGHHSRQKKKKKQIFWVGVISRQEAKVLWQLSLQLDFSFTYEFLDHRYFKQ